MLHSVGPLMFAEKQHFQECQSPGLTAAHLGFYCWFPDNWCVILISFLEGSNNAEIAGTTLNQKEMSITVLFQFNALPSVIHRLQEDKEVKRSVCLPLKLHFTCCTLYLAVPLFLSVTAFYLCPCSTVSLDSLLCTPLFVIVWVPPISLPVLHYCSPCYKMLTLPLKVNLLPVYGKCTVIMQREGTLPLWLCWLWCKLTPMHCSGVSLKNCCVQYLQVWNSDL